MKKTKKQRMTVSVKVSPILREFIVSTNKSNVIVPSKHDWLWLLIKQHLIVDDAPYHRITPEEEKELVHIEILDCHSSKTMTNQQNQRMPKAKNISKGSHEVHINSLFRHTLSAKGQEVIKNFLYRNFKATFHTFMLATKMANPEIETITAIRNFIDAYEIDQEAITEAMLTKSWQRSMKYDWIRSRQKRLLDYDEQYCPAVF